MSIVNHPEFCSYWNSLFLPDIIHGLNSAAKGREVIGFIHGYNAPYSLAKIQSIEVAKRIAGVKPNKSILFLQVYWPSGNRKFALFSSDPNCCNYSNMEDRFTKKDV
jgi:esterase/lipase superfamily enzyme